MAATDKVEACSRGLLPDRVVVSEVSVDSVKLRIAEQRRARQRERARERWRRITLVSVVVVALAAAGAYAVASLGRVHPGVRIAGVALGGLTPAQAVSKLERELGERISEPVVVTHGASRFVISADDIGLGVDAEAMVAEAMRAGRSGSVPEMASARIRAFIGRLELPARLTVDESRLASVLDRIAAKSDRAPKDARVVVRGTTLDVVPGSGGRALDRERARRSIITAFIAGERTVAAPVVAVAPAIGDKEARAARAVAKRMLASGVRITHEDRSWEFGPGEIASWLAFRRSDQASDGAVPADPARTAPSVEVTLVPYISAERLAPTVAERIGQRIGRPAQDARFTTRAGRVSIIPSRTGIGPDIARLADDLTRELGDPASDRVVELRTALLEPRLTTEEARAMGVRERLGSYTTTYDASNRPRVNNIHLLGDALDGTLIEPGGVFSFNGTVGERTAAKGYQEAGAIVNGKLVQQLGGGICQVGTTLFNAIFESGLPVLERRNHSFYISHYPAGRDATVSWGGPDLKFKNDTSHWVLISVSYTSSSITISLYGTDPGYEVESSVSDWRNIKPYPTETIEDPTMYVGTRVVEEKGVTGRTITVTRTVRKGGEVVRTDTFVSVYRPKAQVVRVGTKPRPRTPGSVVPTPSAGSP